MRRIETRWKVRRNVYAGELESVLNKLQSKGYSIDSMHVMVGRFVVVAYKRVRVQA